jgi:hypothetical protein
VICRDSENLHSHNDWEAGRFSTEAWSKLGHEYRVIAHVTVWSSNDAVTVPVAALFRQGDAWAVFSVRDGRA